MFSGRVPANLTANRLSTELTRLQRDERPILDLTQSNPTRAGFAYPADLLSSLSDPGGLTYEPRALGLRVATEAVAADYARRGVTVRPELIALTASTSEAYSLIFKILCDAGDEVLVPRPSYPLFEHLTRLDAVAAVPYDLEYHGAWSIDLGSIERALTARCRALLLVNPNNPTGSFVSRDDFDAVATLCSARDIAIISDEVFADYELTPGAARAAGSLLERRDVLGFTLGGLSKSIGLPQAKLAWTVLSGGPALVREARERLELACDTYLSVSTPVQIALPQLLERGAGIRRQIQNRVTINQQQLARLAEGVPSCRVLAAEGGWSVVVQVPSLMPEEDLVLTLLGEDHVLVHPGYFFDFASESFLILSLLVPETAFAEGVARVLQRIQTLAGGS